MNNQNEILTVGEVAIYLRVHRSTVYRLLRCKQIPAFKVGSDWRFERGSVDQWMRDRITNGSPPLDH